MKTTDADILIVPGLGGSGPDHWQTRWQSKLATARRVEQADWDHPEKSAWMARIAESIAESERPIVIVAHSLGVIATAHVLAEIDHTRVAGAFLVAPPNDGVVHSIAAIDPTFAPYPDTALNCPSVLVGSTNDPYGSIASTAALAHRWDAAFLDAGAAGHINTESGHGPWPEGLMAFAGFMAKL